MATIMRVGGGAGGGKSSNPAVSTLAEEKILLITENGIPTEYYIAKHGYEAELNGANRTLLRRKESHSARVWDSGGVKDYATSDVDAWMNGDFYNSLSSGVRDLIGATTFYYTDINANVSTLDRAVFLRSVAELGLTHSNGNTEGSALPIASTLRIAKLNGTASNQWTRSVYKTTNPYVYFLNASGAVNSDSTDKAYGVPVAFTIPHDAKIIGPDNYGRYSLECESVGDVYGIARDITASSPEWTRTDGAMTFSAKASIGTVAGKSDFDNIYPWSEMKRVTLDTGDVMVRIPKFYYGRYRNGNIERIQISGRADVGLSLHPAFNHGGVEADCIYVGAYCAGGNGANSKSGLAPSVWGTRAACRTAIRNKGAGWHLLDISTLSAIQMLYLVEFANNNSQAMVGRGYCDGNAAAINTGSCDTVPNLTGRPIGTDGKTDVVYRGIEGLWGNVWEYVDGCGSVGSNYYVCNNPSQYADDTTANYTKLSYTVSSGYSGSYIQTVGLDGSNAYVMFPQTAAGSETTYYCDSVSTVLNQVNRVCLRGGDWDEGSACGLFMTHFGNASSASAGDITSRIIYIPQ